MSRAAIPHAPMVSDLVCLQAWYMHPAFSVLIGGILPFGAVFIELFFILTSMWLHQFYYLFGFLCLVFVILIITCAEITIVLCYFQLCSEDYHWWCVLSSLLWSLPFCPSWRSPAACPEHANAPSNHMQDDCS